MLQREKDILQNELRQAHELIARLQQQQHQHGVAVRSSKIDQLTLQKKQVLEKKLSNADRKT